MKKGTHLTQERERERGRREERQNLPPEKRGGKGSRLRENTFRKTIVSLSSPLALQRKEIDSRDD